MSSNYVKAVNCKDLRAAHQKTAVSVDAQYIAGMTENLEENESVRINSGEDVYQIFKSRKSILSY